MSDGPAIPAIPASVSHWCILRTSGPSTLSLVRSFIAAGIGAWTPTEMVKRRLPRGRKGSLEREAAMLPTYVFVPSVHLPELLRCLSLPLNPHPAFSIYRYCGSFYMVADRHLNQLRAIEEKATRKRKKKEHHVFPIGAAVAVEEAAFTGLPGVVVGNFGKTVTISFGGSMEWQIPAFLVRETAVKTDPIR